MSREVLTETSPDVPLGDNRPVVGFFGKLPSTGDFVWRGLPDVFRRYWDGWITRTVAPLQQDGAAFPAGGLRFLLASGGRTAAGLVLASQDSVGRGFPLSLMLIADGGLTQDQTDSWCDLALTLMTPKEPPLSPDDLWQRLDALPAPDPQGPATGSFRLWTAGSPALAATPEGSSALIRQLLSLPQD